MNTDNNLLKSKTKSLQRSIKNFLEINRKGTPLTMSFLVTNRCNLCCKHCFYHYNFLKSSQKSPQELTIDEYIKISNSMENFMKGIFSGGEPFLREDLYEIIYLFQKKNKVLWCSSSTNGQNAEKIIFQVDKIVSRNPYHHFSLALSLDGFQEYHDLIRGSGTFQKAINTWHELCHVCKLYKNLEIYICPTINSINKNIMPKFIDWCVDELKPAFVSLLKIRQEPRDGVYLKDINIDEYDLCKNVIEKQIKKNKMGDINQPQTYINYSICYYVSETLKTGKRSFQCFAGKHGGFIDYDGNVGVCEIIEYLGNLRDYNYDFLALWNDEKNIAQRSRIHNESCCIDCTHETEGIIPSIFFGDNKIITDL